MLVRYKQLCRRDSSPFMFIIALLKVSCCGSKHACLTWWLSCRCHSHIFELLWREFKKMEQYGTKTLMFTCELRINKIFMVDISFSNILQTFPYIFLSIIIFSSLCYHSTAALVNHVTRVWFLKKVARERNQI